MPTYQLEVNSVPANELTNPMNTSDEVYVATRTFVDEDDVYARDAAQAAMRDYPVGYSGILHGYDADGGEWFVTIVESMPDPSTYQQMLVRPDAVDAVRQLSIEHPDGPDGLLYVDEHTGYGHATVPNEFVDAAAQFGAVIEY